VSGAFDKKKPSLMKALILALAALLLVQTGCSTMNRSHPEAGLLAANKAVVVKSHQEIWSKGSLDAIDELYTRDFICHFVIGPEWEGRAGLRDQVFSHRASFPDWHEDIVRLVAEGNLVVSHFMSSGTHLGAFQGLAPTSRKVSIDEIAIYRLEDGKIAEQWGFPDVHGMNVQLGIVEPDGPADGDGGAVPAPILQMRKVVETPSEESEAMAVHGSAVGEVLNVGKEVLFDQKALKAAVVQDRIELPSIAITFTEEGRRRFAAFTRDNIGTRLAIIIDGRLYCAPAIRAEIPGGKAEISGNFTEQEARNLAAKITEVVKKN